MRYLLIIAMLISFSCSEKKPAEQTVFVQPEPYSNLPAAENGIIPGEQTDDPAGRFTDKLDGTWIKIDGSSTCIVNFDKAANEIIMYDGEENLQEVYRCSSFSKTKRSDTFYMVGTNDMIPFIRMNFTIQLFSDGRCWITVKESGIKNEKVIWTGSYTRMTGYDDPTRLDDNSGTILLSGLYTGNSFSLRFSDSSFEMEKNGEKTVGIYSVYHYNRHNILELRFRDKEVMVTGTECYRITFSVDEKDNYYLDILTLERGSSTPEAFVSYGEEELVLTRQFQKELE